MVRVAPVTAAIATIATRRQRGDGSRPVGKSNGTNSVSITVAGTHARAVSQATHAAPGMPAWSSAVAAPTPPNASARSIPPSQSSHPIGWRTNRVTRTAPLVTRVSDAMDALTPATAAMMSPGSPAIECRHSMGQGSRR